ncbi:MAG: TRAP transporter small permease [Desulfotignum sp.]|nr:TRAP transporter small permease [Desulfotignum sp.]
MGMAMALVVGIQVFSRYGLNYSLFWSEELARFLLIWLSFLGATVAYFHGAHPGVDSLVRRLPDRMKTGALILSYLAGAALFCVMVVSGTQFAWFVRLQITPALGVSKWIIMAVVPVSGAIFLVHCLAGVCRVFDPAGDGCVDGPGDRPGTGPGDGQGGQGR